MKRFKTLFISTVIGTSMLLSACVKTIDHSSTTYVRDLVQSDVFTVLPDNGSEIMIYNTSKEIKGEYLELASLSVEMESKTEAFDKQALIAKLKTEAELLGGNGILVMEETGLEKGNREKYGIKAIAVFTLDEIPNEQDEYLASLPI